MAQPEHIVTMTIEVLVTGPVSDLDAVDFATIRVEKALKAIENGRSQILVGFQEIGNVDVCSIVETVR